MVLLMIVVSHELHADFIWSEATPTAIHILPDGLVLEGAFDQTGVSCATAPSSIFLVKNDPQFDAKLSLALTAYATSRKIRVLLLTTNSTCHTVSAMGDVPVAHDYYWRIND